MNNVVRRAGRMTLLVGVAVVGLASMGFLLSTDTSLFFKINKSIDIFGRVYKEITANYVDEVDPEKFMQAGIDGMLATLDPYTVYIDKDEGDEVDLLTNGKYGGIGVTIGVRDGGIRVITVMDGYSAQRQGVLPGDKIIEVDGTKIGSMSPSEVRDLTRGDPGTEVKVRIEREGEKAPLDFVLVREEIQVKNVTYSGFVSDGIGYIRLERFSRQAGDDVRQAIRGLKLGGDLKGLILDLRGNPGGLLDAAVDVVSKFVPKGSLIVSTRGRRAEADRKYVSTEEPMLPATPLIVLTDRGSASASEIVAGALQDLDRAVILGTRTFGKGLVQTIVSLSYGAQLKITTARYYTPSGRCIQEIDYLHRDKNGVFAAVPDSLRKEFATANGRKVFEHGGIMPDSVLQESDPGPMVRELHRKSLLFKFVNRYVAAHKDAKITAVTDDMLSEFQSFLKEEHFDYQEESETKVADLRTIAEKSHYSRDVLADLDLLSTALNKEKVRGFERYRDHISNALQDELMARLHGDQGRIKASLTHDKQVQAAVGVLDNSRVYTRKLQD